jgi:V8-like Glu-specific endopeptidase
MIRCFKSLSNMLAALALLLLTTSVLAQEPKPASIDGVAAAQLVATKVISPAEQKAALAYWSRRAIAAAEPMMMLAQPGSQKVDTAAALPEIAEAPGSSPAGMAAPEADRAARAAYPRDWAIIERAAAEAEIADPTLADPATADAAVDGAERADSSQIGPAGTSQVYTSYVVNQVAAMQTMYPHRWIGRLNFNTPDGASFCSATSISGNVMVTAAHCLYDSTTNRWFSNWVFAPAYRNGSAPFGTFAATQCWVLNAWINQTGNYSIDTWARHDVGVCKMGNNSAGTTLNNAVGWSARQWNAPYIRHFHVLGYPLRNFNNAVIAGGGLYLRTCVAESLAYTTETRGVGCNLGGGISGGPWMINYAPGAVSGIVDGVNSGLFVGAQNMYGARFNSSNIVPLCTVAKC